MDVDASVFGEAEEFAFEDLAVGADDDDVRLHVFDGGQ